MSRGAHRGGRVGRTFHEGGRGWRTNWVKRSVVIDILGLPLAVSVESARPHEVSAGRRLLDTTLPALLGRWRRLSRCHEAAPESTCAWLEVPSLGYLFAQLRAEPA